MRTTRTDPEAEWFPLQWLVNLRDCAQFSSNSQVRQQNFITNWLGAHVQRGLWWCNPVSNNNLCRPFVPTLILAEWQENYSRITKAKNWVEIHVGAASARWLHSMQCRTPLVWRIFPLREAFGKLRWDKHIFTLYLFTHINQIYKTPWAGSMPTVIDQIAHWH